ncbi:MAG: AtpZ/AtpI family protein [Streptosporangiaceae bacterium]
MPTNESRSSDEKPGFGAFALLGLGVANAGAVVVGCVLGWLVDSRLGTTPAFIVVGGLVGIVSGVLGMYREIRKYLQD